MPRQWRSGWHLMCPNRAFHDQNFFPHSLQGLVIFGALGSGLLPTTCLLGLEMPPGFVGSRIKGAPMGNNLERLLLVFPRKPGPGVVSETDGDSVGEKITGAEEERKRNCSEGLVIIAWGRNRKWEGESVERATVFV